MPARHRGHWKIPPLAMPIAVAALGLVSLGVAEDLPNRHAVEAHLTFGSVRALDDAGIRGAQVRFSGRDGTVYVRSDADRGRALAIVRSQPGVRVARVIVDGSPNSTPSAPRSAAPTSPARTSASASAAPTANAPPNAPTPPPSSAATPPSAVTPPSASVPSASVPKTPAPTSSSPVPPQSSGPGSGAGAAAVAEVRSELAATGPIRFAVGSAALTPSGRAIVATIAAILRTHPSVDVVIEGFADSSGTVATNLAISRRRAEAVYSTLRVLGIASSRLEVLGLGESHPVAPNDTPAHRAANRRVTFVVR
jgi:outer membrane protein OmpA-like peptidoglycan-associated protein